MIAGSTQAIPSQYALRRTLHTCRGGSVGCWGPTLPLSQDNCDTGFNSKWGHYILVCTSTCNRGQDLDPSNFHAWPLDRAKNLALILDYLALITPIDCLESLWPLAWPWFLPLPLDQLQKSALTTWPFDPGHGWEHSHLCSVPPPPLSSYATGLR